jgi:hypothetical protein
MRLHANLFPWRLNRCNTYSLVATLSGAQDASIVAAVREANGLLAEVESLGL